MLHLEVWVAATFDGTEFTILWTGQRLWGFPRPQKARHMLIPHVAIFRSDRYAHDSNIWWYGYGSIPINTIFRGMNIHLPAILMFTRGTRFWPTAILCDSIPFGQFIDWIQNSAWHRVSCSKNVALVPHTTWLVWVDGTRNFRDTVGMGQDWVSQKKTRV